MRNRAENLQSIYVLLFLEIAFFFFQIQNPEKYVAFFGFDGSRVLAGEVWRIFTFQFIHSGPLALFFDLLVLYIMGSAVEEVCGTFDFLLFLVLSILGAAGVGFALGVPLIGSYFSSFALLFIFATIAPDQVFYIFFVLPLKVRWIAYAAAGFLAFGVFRGDIGSVAALAGTALSYGAYLVRHRRPRLPSLKQPAWKPGFSAPAAADQGLAERNLAQFDTMKKALATGSIPEVDSLIAQIEPKIVPGVNICPPADYKPEHEDRYCVRCEGFAECSVRYLRMKSESAERDNGG